MTPWVFLSVTFIIISSTYFYVGWRIIIPAQFSAPWNWIAWSVLALSVLFLFVPFVLTVMRIYNPIIDVLAWIGYITMGFFSLVFAFILV
ncbi:MAG: hypothetical protein R3250_05255, partial [Melioribacteraceae bacterium]|nr:hypothetical protein [Melioribacteraceae bacterium]